MKTRTVNILAGNNSVGSSLMSIVDFIHFANALWRFQHPDVSDVPLLDYRIYAAQGSEITFSNGMGVAASPITDYKEADAVFLVSSMASDKTTLEEYIETSRRFSDILLEANRRKQWIASYCTGTFGLGASGVLTNKKATSVWWLANLFQRMFPDTELTLDEIVIVDENVITGGATTSYFNVCLRLIEELTNEVFARQLSKILLIDRHRLSQQAFIDSGYVLNNKDKLVESVQTWMVSNYASAISLDKICDEFSVTKRTLIRRFKSSCNDTPLNYLQRIRVEKARHYLETTSLPVERIVEKVGYEDAASFRKLFASHTQLTPKAYRERFACCE